MKNATLKRGLRVALLMVLVVMSLFSLTACGGKKFEVETDVTQQGIILEFDNETGSNMSIGWTNSEIVIETDTGTYTAFYGMGLRIPRGNSTHLINASQYKGTVERIEIPEISCLSDRGLPNEKKRNLVIYDIKKDIDSYEGSFSFFSSRIGSGVLVGMIGFGLIITIVIVVIILVVRSNRRNKAAMQQFAPFGTQNVNGGFDMQQQMHQDAHRRMVDDHQRFVNQEFNNQAMRDVSQSSNNNGFTPPPAPPAPPMGN